MNQLHSRDRRRYFGACFGRSYFKSAPLVNPSLAFGLAMPCLILLAVACITLWPHASVGMSLAIAPVVGSATDERIRDLQDRLMDLHEHVEAIQAKADGEKRPLTEEEIKEIDRSHAEFRAIEEDIGRRQAQIDNAAKLSQPQDRRAEPQNPDPQQNADPQNGPTQGVSAIRPKTPVNHRPTIYSPEGRGRWGWNLLGDFALAVKAASAPSGAVVDPRLVMNAPTTYSSEGSGADGGFAVPPDFRTEIWKKISAETSLFGRTDQYPTSRNTIVLPADETTPWAATGGVQAYFESEGGQMSQSKIALTEKTIRLNKLTALVPITEELLEDAPGLDAYLRSKVAEKFDFKLNLKIVQGTGAGEPLGILNAASLVSVSKETSQAADTIQVENIDKMFSRMYAPLRAGAVWLVNQDVEPQLFGLMRYVKDASGNIVAGAPAYMPPGGVSGLPYGTLYGKEIVPTQACETLGDKGDIIFVNLKAYMTAYKQGGVRADVSMHLWFDYSVMAYRFILRIAGQPWWADHADPRDGSNTLSWAVTLDERAAG